MSTEAGRSSDRAVERLPDLRPQVLDEAQHEVYRAITGGRRARGPQLFRMAGSDGALLGPFGPMVLHPSLGRPLQALGAALRYDGSLSAGAREIVICTVAATCRSTFEWYAHVSVARSLGVPETVLDSLYRGEAPRELSEEEGCAHSLAVHVLAGSPVTHERFATAQAELGHAGVMEVVTLVGYYRLLADLMAVFDTDGRAEARGTGRAAPVEPLPGHADG